MFSEKECKKRCRAERGQTNFCVSKNACTLAGENACVFSFARNKDGIFGVILSRFRSTKTEKTRKKRKYEKHFSKKGQKTRIFDDIYIVRFRTYF